MVHTIHPVTASQRLLSLDILRGFTVAAMVLVTDPGTYSYVYPQLSHAKWNNPTATDLIFPCFLVMVGVSMTLSFAARLRRGYTHRDLVLHVIRRSVLLIVLGLLVNGFPDYDLAHLRLPGILQRISVCYLIVSLLYLVLCRSTITRRTRQLTLAVVCFGLLGIYWALLRFYPTPGFGPGRLDPVGTLPAVLDRALFTAPHMFPYGTTPGYGVTFDPEGVLSTLGALGTTLLGVLAGDELRNGGNRRCQCARLAVAGAALWFVSLVLSRWLPLNKQIYTPTFALWSAGLSILIFAALFYLIDIRNYRRGWTLALIFGTNAIFAFVLSGIVTTAFRLLYVTTAQGRFELHIFLYQRLFATWLAARPASLAYAILIVLFNAVFIYPLYRRRIFLRI